MFGTIQIPEVAYDTDMEDYVVSVLSYSGLNLTFSFKVQYSSEQW